MINKRTFNKPKNFLPIADIQHLQIMRVGEFNNSIGTINNQSPKHTASSGTTSAHRKLFFETQRDF